MNIATLSRKEKRLRIAKAAKLYGIKGEESLALHEAYLALGRGEVGPAVQLAHPVIQSHPGNPHGWMILGGAALNQREGATAKAFFEKALEAAPRNVEALAGLAKAHVLNAEVEEAVTVMTRAIRAGSRDVPLMMLFIDLMSRLGRRLSAADILIPAARPLRDARLALAVGDLLSDADETGAAAEWLERAWKLDPEPELNRIARLRALLYQVRLEEAEALARSLLDSVKERDTVMLVLLTVLRSERRLDEAEALADSFEFATPEGFAQARGIVANIRQDRGDRAGADDAYVEAIHITGETSRVRKAYGAFLLRQGKTEQGAAQFADRFPEMQRRRIPLENATPEALSARERLYLMAEQGIGDQLAFIGMLGHAPVPDEADRVFVGDPRMGALMKDNRFGLRHIVQEDFLGGAERVAPEELIYLGDLVRYMPDDGPAAPGGFLAADQSRRDHYRHRYEALAQGRPIVGAAWASRSLQGRLRSMTLADLVTALPEGALVVDLQYRSTSKEIADARAVRPDLKFHQDREVDQMADLAGFAAQLAALDEVVTIDNTTAHMCGALGRSAHVLLPGGSECMWYWGETGSADRWYGALTLHRQETVGDWGAPLSSVRAAISKN